MIVRPIVVWEPASAFNITFIGEMMNADYSGNDARLLVPSAALLAVYGYTPPSDRYETNQDTDGGASIKTRRAVIEANLETGAGLLTSVSAWRRVRNVARVDQDGTPFPIQLSSRDANRSHQFSQELRFASDFSDTIKLVAGGYYSNVVLSALEQRERNSFAIRTTAPFTQQYAQVSYDQTARTWAGFATADAEVMQDARLSAGLRYTRESKTFEIAPFLTCAGPGFVGCPAAIFHLKRSWNDLSPRIAAQYDASRDLMLYGSWTKGFRSGNFNGRASSSAPAALEPSEPESASAFEAGMKWTFWDRRARLNLTAFRTKYDNIQKVLTTTGTVQSIVNAAAATVNGAEVEFSVKPTSRFQLDASFGWTDAKYERFNGLDLTGDGIPDAALAKQLKFERVPKYTLTISPSYSLSIPGVPGMSCFAAPIAGGTGCSSI